MRLWNSKSISSIYILARTRPVFNFAGKTGGQKTCVTVYLYVLRTVRHSQTHTASTPPREHPPVLCTLSADTVRKYVYVSMWYVHILSSRLCEYLSRFLRIPIYEYLPAAREGLGPRTADLARSASYYLILS